MKHRLWITIIAVTLLAVVLVSCRPGGVAQITPTPTKTPRPAATDTSIPTATPLPTDTATPLPTDTPVPPTNTPTAEPTATEVVTETLPTDVPTAEPPTNTPPPANTPRPAPTKTPAPPTNTPAPKVDFKVVEQRLVPKQLNEAGLHSFFVAVVDAGGNPLHGLVVWDPAHPDQEAKTGDKPDPYSAEYQMWTTDNYFLEVKGFKSEKTKGLSTDRPKISNQDLIAAGYCSSDADCNQNVHTMHFSWYVTFKRTW